VLLLCKVRTASSKTAILAVSTLGSQFVIALQSWLESKQLPTNSFTGAQLPMIRLKQKCQMQFEPKKKKDDYASQAVNQKKKRL